MQEIKKKSITALERISIRVTRWVGSVSSILVHTALFIVSFILYFFGVNIDKILLVVTTIVSLEAIYLAIFIQMSVNRQNRRLRKVAHDIDEIQEDVEGIEKDIDEIQEDIEEDEREEAEEEKMMERIEDTLGKLAQEIIELKKQHKENEKK
ncbi:MAG: hypothetical protein PHT84_00705 [Candidatus Pacebacteria bacterium]|nr:hypothetical protein [Candidatus Paceibacterota bacterium]